ncbi:MAG TPA: TonB-dependent receptor plug domain-containing protein, partial [Gammaproteobacteria bacterium]
MRKLNTALIASTLVLPYSISAQAQQEQVLEEVFVTGSLIRRSSFEGPSAVQQVTAEDIQIEGASTIQDVVRNLSINTGSHLARFAPEFGGSSGATSQFNLRGLGINATLTLVDGRRLAPSPSSGMGGAQFVNINQIPASMIERVDILKTGASATYGSEAVAGVVNIITKKNFEGFEFNVDTRDSDTVPWSETSISAIGGAASDRARATVGFEIQNRDLLKTIQLPSHISDTLVFRTSFGQPGAFNVRGTFYTDPNCGQPGQTGLGQSIPPGTFPEGRCSASLKEFFTALPNDERTTAWANTEYDLTDNTTAYAQIGYSKQDTFGTGPTSTVPNRKRVTVPANHPDWPQELIDAIVADTGSMQNALLWGRHVLNNADSFTQQGGRPLGGGGLTNLRYRNFLTVLGAQGDFEIGSGRRWDWDVSWTGSYNNAANSGRATSHTRWQAAINNCLDPSDPLWQQAAGCWNPFSNSYTPGYTGTVNTQAMFDWISPYDTAYIETELEVVNAQITGGLMDMPGGELSFA